MIANAMYLGLRLIANAPAVINPSEAFSARSILKLFLKEINAHVISIILIKQVNTPNQEIN